MALDTFAASVKNTATDYLKKIENYFAKEKVDVLAYFGSIDANYEQVFRSALDGLVAEQKATKHKTLCIVLTTFGGSIETTEKFVNMTRQYYKQVFFIVPNYAMSAGTIWCMSGNRIYMDYSSSLGPIDTQIFSPVINQYVPANGYIAEYEELLKKGASGNLSNEEFVLLAQKLDYAFLNRCKKLGELTVKLLQDWLVLYKFKDWKTTKTRKVAVTSEMKRERAKEIATKLGNDKHWCIHSRPIMIKDLNAMKLHIDDYSENEELRKIVRDYSDFMSGYLKTAGLQNGQFIHTRLFM